MLSLSRYQDDINNTTREWYTRNRDFGSAYSRAFTSYWDTIKKQVDADRAAAERKAQLVMLALSLAGGSALLSVFGKSATKAVASDLAKDAALNMTVNRGWEKAFNALAWADANPAVNFVFGKLWDDEVAKRMTTEMTNVLKKIPDEAKLPTGPVGIQPQPLEFQNDLMNHTDRCANAASAAGTFIHDSFGGEGALAQLRKTSAFFQVPKTQIDKVKMADRIELALWMKFTLDQDYLEKGYIELTGRDSGELWRKVVTSRESIDANPWKKSYPHSSTGEHGWRQQYESVGYKKIGDVIRKRINELYKNNNIGSWIFSSSIKGHANASKETLRNAQTTLFQLADRNAREIQTALTF